MKNPFKNRSFFKNGSIIIATGLLIFAGCSSDSPSEPTKKGPQVLLSPAENLYFGQIPNGQTASREFIIFNTGDEEVVISEMKIEGSDAASFSLEDNYDGMTVPINKIESFAVNFNPAEIKSFEAQVTITTNASTSPDVQALVGDVTSNAGNITFERIIGSSENDGGGAVRVLDDGGFIIAGSSYNATEDETLATLFRLDRYGNLLWQQQYPVAGLSSFSGLVVTADGDYVCTGSTRNNPASNRDAFALSADDNGNFLWQEVYELGGTQHDDGHDIIMTSQGGYVIGGSTNNTNDATGGVKDAMLLKITNNGSYEWHKVYGTREGEEANSVKELSDGGYILAGSTTAPSEDPGGDFDFLLIRTDSEGNQVWLKSYGGDRYDFASSVVVDELGGYVIAGYTASFGAGARDYWLLKTDEDGIEQWNETYGGPENDSVSEIIQTSDNGFYIVGGSASFTTNQNGQPTGQVWVIKTDNSGAVDWDELYGGKGGDSGSSVRELDGGYIISGGTSSFSDNGELYVLRTNTDGSI